MSKSKERRRRHIIRKLQRREGEGRKAYLARQRAIRFARDKTAELELKNQPIQSNADRLQHRLMFGKLPPALDLTIQKLSRTGHRDSRHRMVDAFVTVLIDLPTDCEAAVAAVIIAEEIGMPLDGDRKRDVVLDWLRQSPTTEPVCLPGEQLTEIGHAGIAAVTAQSAGIENYNPSRGASRAPGNRSVDHSSTERSHGMNYRRKPNALATPQRKLSRRHASPGVTRSSRSGLSKTRSQHSSKNSTPGFHEAEQFELTDLLASLNAHGKPLGTGGVAQPGERK